MTPEELENYQREGYVVVRGLFSPDEIAPWLERLTAIVRGEVPRSERMVVMRDVMVAKGAVAPKSQEESIAKLQDFDHDPVLRSYTENPKILDRIAPIVGEHVVAIHNMLINKPPGVDGRHPLHQDLLYFPFRPAARIVASWTALEPVDRENGCLAVVPGTHTGELLPHENPDWEYLNLGYFGAVGVGAHPGRVHLPMQPGDTVFFHPVLLHGSGRNRSAGFRRAISSHYAAADCRFLDESNRSAARRYRMVRGQIQPGGLLDDPAQPAA